MKKILLFGSLLLGSYLSVNAQQILFQDDFESYDDFIISDIGEWTQIDLDGAPTYIIDDTEFENQGYTGTAIVFNSSMTDPGSPNLAAHAGDKSLNFFAALIENEVDEDLVGPNNDWIITPQITLGSAGNNVTFWARSSTDMYGLERLRVLVSSDGNTNTADFTAVSTGNYLSVPAEWTQYTISLDAYAGQDVYIALNYLSNDAFILLVDDFAVTTTDTAGLNSSLLADVKVYPNPSSNVVNVNSANALVNAVNFTDLNGRVVKSAKFNGAADAQVNISDLASGVYMMNISSDKGITVKKIVKN